MKKFRNQFDLIFIFTVLSKDCNKLLKHQIKNLIYTNHLAWIEGLLCHIKRLIQSNHFSLFRNYYFSNPTQ